MQKIIIDIVVFGCWETSSKECDTQLIKDSSPMRIKQLDQDELV